jgi:hypothetical protein
VGLELDDPDPECVKGHGVPLVEAAALSASPQPSPDHSRPSSGAGPVPVRLMARRPA